jgi:glutamine amidotransferase-like uncharacterized protein/effector-binding domain-containing protein
MGWLVAATRPLMPTSTLLCTLLCAPAQAVSAPEVKTGETTICIIPGDTYAARKITGSYSGLGAAFQEVGQWVAGHAGAVQVAGASLSVLRDDPAAVPEEKLRSEAWIPIRWNPAATAPRPSGQVIVHTEPPRLVVRALHHGPVAEVRESFDRLHQSLRGKGLRFVGPSWHVYLTNPNTTPPADQRSEVRIAVEPTGKSDLGIYTGSGVHPQLLLALSTAATRGGLSVRPLDAEAITDGRLSKRCRALVLPGGELEDYVRDLGEAGGKRIREFVSKGNGYAGVGAGAFLAARQVEWLGQRMDLWLELFPGIPTGPLQDIAPWPEHELTIIEVDRSHAITKKFAGERAVLYRGGPRLQPEEGAKVKILARYRGQDAGPAMVALTLGRARIFLSGVHLELQLGSDRERFGWPAQEPKVADPEPDHELLTSALRWVVR